MIAIETMDGELVKIIKNTKEAIFGFHKLFGLTSLDKATKRADIRKRQGFEFTSTDWHCQFKITQKENGLSISGMNDCEVKAIDKSIWSLVTPLGDFKISNMSTAVISDDLFTEIDENSWMGRWTELIILGVFILIPILYFMRPSEVIDEKKEEKKKEPITVTLVKQVKTVQIAQKKPSIKVKPLTDSQISKRAVKRNLGFLGLVGSKDLTKAVGGVPQKLKKATAGAGKGGDAGSGGEVLTGLGKGLKKTTVGNTGVAGLGGIGTKGAGGGAGGYGNTMVASGEGKGISAISVASNDMVLDGGLSRYAINATIAKYLSQVRRCYEAQLNKKPGLEGLVTVSFQINGAGRLDFSRVLNSTLGNAAAEKCITTKMMGWQFPKPKGGVKVPVKYPFMLRPVGT